MECIFVLVISCLVWQYTDASSSVAANN